MGKPTGKKKDSVTPKAGNASGKANKQCEKASKAFDEDTAIFINMSQDLKEEGNKLFQKRDHEGAMLKFEKALKLLPLNHIDVAHLRTNMAACYMQLGLGEYPRAINECNLALEVSPRYSKALLRRAKCYEALNRFDYALRDVNFVLSVEPNNLNALEVLGSLRKAMEEKGVSVDEKDLVSLELPTTAPMRKVVREKLKKKKSKKGESKPVDKVILEDTVNAVKDKEVVVTKTIAKKEVMPKKIAKKEIVLESVKEEKVVTRTVKLVFGEDIRWAQLPLNCGMRLVRDVIKDRFPGLKGVLVKYKDKEGDLVTITTTDELRLAESSGDVSGSFRLYISEVNPEEEPTYDGIANGDGMQGDDGIDHGPMEPGKDLATKLTNVEDWIIQFARMFKNHVGFDSDSYLDMHEEGMKLYSEALEDVVTNDDAQELFEIAADKFQEMAALALFNWGNVHMSRARRRVPISEDGSKESAYERIKAAYELARKEYKKAEMRYEEALKIKPDFYEGFLALGHEQFEQAKVCWYYAMACKTNLEDGPSSEVLLLYNKAEDSMDRGMLMWEEIEEQRLNGLSKLDKYRAHLEKMGLDGLLKDISSDEAAEQAANARSQIYILWGTILYERSVVEYKLGLPSWEECLEVAVEKFELAGASPTDIGVMVKNHCSNQTALEGLGFKIDEIVQAWNEMYDAQRWQFGVPSFRLESLFRRCVPRLHHILEHF